MWMFVALAAVGFVADGISSKFVPNGVTAKVGGYRPIRAELDAAADSVKKAPEGLKAPKYGSLKIDDKSWAVIVDESEGEPGKLFVDTNGDSDLTNDPECKWTPNKRGELTMYQGTAEVDLGGGTIAGLGLYKFDPKDESRPQLKNTILFYTDYGYEVTIDLDGKSYSTFVSGEPGPGTQFWIDRDGNGVTSYKREMAAVGKPFNFTGTTYVINFADGKLTLDRATEDLPLAPMPPNLAVGQKAIEFSMATMDGEKVEFPKSYAGKVVMLDFWATWCGPCVAEIPNMKQAYTDWNDKGFEILGVSLDSEEMADKIKEFTTEKEMPWKQIYEGKGWEVTLGESYDVSAIPFVLLVDGDTGEILANAKDLRGPKLTEFIGKVLEKKKGEVK